MFRYEQCPSEGSVCARIKGRKWMRSQIVGGLLGLVLVGLVVVVKVEEEEAEILLRAFAHSSFVMCSQIGSNFESMDLNYNQPPSTYKIIIKNTNKHTSSANNLPFAVPRCNNA